MKGQSSPPIEQTVLVTDGDQRSALAVVRSLGRAGHKVHVAAPRKSSRFPSLAGASRYVAREWIVPDALNEPSAFAEAIKKIVAETGATIVLPITEASLLSVLPLRESLGAIVPFAEESAFRAISHKGVVLDKAREFGIAAPEQYVVESPDDVRGIPFHDFCYPLVIKPARSVAEGSGPNENSRAKFTVQHVASADALREALAEMDPRGFPILLQQRVVGPGVGIFVLIWNGELLAAFSHQRVREKPPSGGVSVYRVSRPMDATLLEKSRALLAAFNWNGVAMVEYKVDDRNDTPYLMEINGRFWGSLQLAIDAGVDFPSLLVRAATGQNPTPVVTYRNPTGSRWFWGDMDHLLARFRRSDVQLALPPRLAEQMAGVARRLHGEAGRPRRNAPLRRSSPVLCRINHLDPAPPRPEVMIPYIGAVHIHSDYSHDGHDTLEQLRDRSVERGIQFLGMTEHAEDLIPEVWAEYKNHCKSLSTNDITIIPGLEYRFAGMRGMHLFALGLQEWIAPKTPEEFFDQTQGNAVITVLAHPVLARYEIPHVVYDRVDAIEVWNGNYNTRYLPDPRAIRIVQALRARRPEVVATVGLDQHDSTNDRELRIVLPQRSDTPLEEIKAGRFFNVGHKMQIDSKADITNDELRALTRKRTAFDMVERAHEFGMKLLHKIGVDR